MNRKMRGKVKNKLQENRIKFKKKKMINKQCRERTKKEGKKL